MRFILPLILCVLAISVQAKPRLKECEPYREKARELQCPKENYFIDFGYKYCREFIKRNNEFSPEGRVILAKIRGCLLERISRNEKLTCENAKSEAQEDHYVCYIESGFCDLDFFDQMTIFDTVYGELSDPDFMETSNRIAAACGF